MRCMNAALHVAQTTGVTEHNSIYNCRYITIVCSSSLSLGYSESMLFSVIL